MQLAGLDFRADGFEVRLSLPLQGRFRFWRDSVSLGDRSIDGPSVRFPLTEGWHEYRIQATYMPDRPILALQIEKYQLPGSAPAFELLYSSLPGPGVSIGHLRRYLPPPSLYGQEGARKAERFLSQTIRWGLRTSDSARVVGICQWVGSLCNNPLGEHFASVSDLPPDQQIEAALRCKAWLACGNYASIYQYLLTAAGIPNRCISYTGSTSAWQYGAHYMNEAYLSDEQQWAVLDGVNNIYLPKTEDGRYLNAADIKLKSILRARHKAKALSIEKGAALSVDYDSLFPKHDYYNRSNASVKYSPPVAKAPNAWLAALTGLYGFDDSYALFSVHRSNDYLRITIKYCLLLAALSLTVAVWSLRKPKS